MFRSGSARIGRLVPLMLLSIVCQPPAATGSGLGLSPGAEEIESGELLVITQPEGAVVLVDLEVMGSTPMEPREVESGWHLVQAEKANLFASARVYVIAGERTTVALTLNGGAGILSVLSTPQAAQVFVDGKGMGNTPVWLDGIRAGKHDVRITKEGYVEYRTSVEIGAGEESRLEVRLPLPAKLDLRSKPEGAAVYLSNRPVGETRLVIDSVRPGQVSVTMRLDNFEEWTETFVLGEGESDTVTAELNARRRPIGFFSNPPGAQLELDGELVGTTPLRWTVPFGERRLTFKLPEYEEYALTVDIEDQMAPDLKVTLTPLKGYLTLRGAPARATATIPGLSGKTLHAPVEGMALPIGTKWLRLEAPGYETLEIQATIRHEEETVLEPEWAPKSKIGGFWRILIPGCSERYQEKRIRGVLIPLLEAGAVIGYLVTTDSYNDAVEAYDTAWSQYLNKVAPAEVEVAWDEARQRYERVEDKESARNLFLAASVGVYLYHLIDTTLLVPETFERRSAHLDTDTDLETQTLRFGVRLPF